MNTSAPITFGSHFSVRLRDANGKVATAPSVTVTLADTIIDEMAPRTSSTPYIGRIDRSQPALGYSYEIPGILTAYANESRVDILCRDLYDPMVSELLDTHAHPPQVGIHRNVSVDVHQVPNLSIQDEAGLAQAAQQTRQLYQLG